MFASRQRRKQTLSQGYLRICVGTVKKNKELLYCQAGLLCGTESLGMCLSIIRKRSFPTYRRDTRRILPSQTLVYDKWTFPRVDPTVLNGQKSMQEVAYLLPRWNRTTKQKNSLGQYHLLRFPNPSFRISARHSVTVTLEQPIIWWAHGASSSKNINTTFFIEKWIGIWRIVLIFLMNIQAVVKRGKAAHQCINMLIENIIVWNLIYTFIYRYQAVYLSAINSSIVRHL